jgi:hypothetical protein
VRDPASLFNAWNMSRAMRCRPSEVYKMTDEFVAYAFDSAVTRWGMAFDSALAEAANSAKNPDKAQVAQERVIRRWLPSERKYADPRQPR